MNSPTELVGAAVYLILEGMLKDRPIVFFEIVSIARDPGHKPFVKVEHLDNLVNEDGVMHSATRAAVLASVSGAGADLHMSNPGDAMHVVRTLRDIMDKHEIDALLLRDDPRPERYRVGAPR